MTDNILQLLVNMIISARDKDAAKAKWQKFIDQTKNVKSIKFTDAISALIAKFEKDDNLGFRNDQLIDFARKFDNKEIKRAVFGLLSLADREHAQDLNEETVTTTANVAAYPIPIGSQLMRRRDDSDYIHKTEKGKKRPKQKPTKYSP